MRLPPLCTWAIASLVGVSACLVGCADPLPPLEIPAGCVGGACEGGVRRSGVRTDGGTGSAASSGPCADKKLNNAETDVDCGGGECEPCDLGAACGLNGDCASEQCEMSVCVAAPTAAFTLSASRGAAPLSVRATSQAHEGSSAIVQVSYDWDDGQGFEPSETHAYRTGGPYVVRQRVVDARGAVAMTSQSLDVTQDFRLVRFSATDRSDNVRLSPDRLSVEQRGLDPGGVRSDASIAPMSRVYYFEVERLIARTGNWGFGLGTQHEKLGGEIGHQRESMGVLTSGSIYNGNTSDQPLANCARTTGFLPATRFFGFVVDYRGANARVHLILEQEGAVVVNNSCTMSVSEPLHIMYAGTRYEIGFQARINTGADTTNRPFHFSLAQLASALGKAGQNIALGDIVYGFGATRALPQSMPPTLVAPADQSVALGTPVTLVATANDVEDGSLTEKIAWLDTASQHHAPVEGVGGTFTFTPSAIGRHPVRISVRDSVGLVTSKLVQIEVTGMLPQPNPVVLAPDAFGGVGVVLSDDNLTARFTAAGKYGIRANTGIYRGSFQYFEAQREKPAANMGVGVVIGEGSLSPYHFDDVPWSCSANLTGNTWRNLIDLTNWDGVANDRYGFAVDYRGEHPIVHVLIGTGSTAKLESSMTLDDVWIPIYPMVYGNPQEGMGPDISINFGAQAFRFDARALVPGGAALQLGWGVHKR